MKLLFFDDFRLGVLKGDNVVDVTSVAEGIPHITPHQMIAGLIENFDDYRGKLEAAVAASDGVPESSVTLRPPLPHPSNIACMAVNYMEDGTRSEPAPINAFSKAPTAVITSGGTMVLPDAPATIFEGEAEMALVIGKTATNVAAADAFDHIFGYMNFVDGSARGLHAAAAFHAMKSRDTFAPIGPYIVTKDEIADPQKLHVQLWNNGEIQQDFNTDDMAHQIARCVEYITAIHTLEPGDILATGTNHGGLNPFQDGEHIELEVEGLGRLSFGIKDDLKRTWKRETRHDRADQGFDDATPQVSGKYA